MLEIQNVVSRRAAAGFSRYCRALLAAAGALALASASVAANAAKVGFVAADSLQVARSDHTATLLKDGRTLVVGGLTASYDVTRVAEVFDPRAGTWTAVAPSLSPHRYHQAVLLLDGRVLVIGGTDATLNEIYDPSTDQWSAVAAMPSPQFGFFTATRLKSGQVLVAGGEPSQPCGYPCATKIAQIYDPVTNTWASTGSMNDIRDLHGAALLKDGKVLVAGGQFDVGTYTASAEVYDPATRRWTRVAPLPVARGWPTLLRLPTGEVAVFSDYWRCDGLADANCGTSMSLFNPAKGTWRAAASMPAPHYAPRTTTLLDGSFVVSGDSSESGGARVDRYDPWRNAWGKVATLGTPRYEHSISTLRSGHLLVTGGTDARNNITTDSVERTRVKP